MKKQIYPIQTLLKVFFLFFFGISISSNAANYYASPDGTGTGTVTNPCAITNAWSKLSSPGDTLFLRGGVYYINAKQSINKTGTSSARICIFAYPGETPVLDFRNEPYGSSYPGVSLAETSSYMHIKGITIRYAGDNGMINSGNNHIIENCTFYGNCDSGLQHKTGGGNLIKNCDSHHNFDYQSTPVGGNADGFADKQYTNENGNTYEGCRSWNNSDDGWDFYQRVGNTIIKNSICYKNGPTSYVMTNHPRATTDATWFANNPSPTITNSGNANGFKLGGDYTVHDVMLTNCLAVGNNARGFDQNNNYGTMTIYNGSAYDNASNYGFGTNSGGTLIIKNSVSLSSQSSNSFNSKTVINTNNSWNTSGITCNATDFISIDSTVILSPRQIDGSLPNIVFMQLADGSDMIDAGIEVGLPYSGNAPDLGCFERGSLDQFPPAVTTPDNKNQSVIENSAIEDIVFTWSAGATSLTVCNLPDGVVALVSETNKTLTITGIPKVSGLYNYTVSTIGGAGSSVSINGQIAVNSANAKKIAYVTLLNDAADTKILDKLNENVYLNVTIVDASISNNSYTNYDMILLSSVPTSSSAGLAEIEAVNKPKLLLKPFQLGASRWNWGLAANTTVSTITVSNKSHEIFSGLTFSGTNADELQLFSSVSTNGVTGITSWYGTPAPSLSLLANAKGASTTTQSIVEIPVGTTMGPSGNTTTTTQRFLMIGVSEYSTANLTATATQLIENACYYLLGMDIPTSTQQTIDQSYLLSEHNGILYIKETIAIHSIEIFTINGKSITKEYNKNQININRFPKGIYIVRIIDLNGNTFVQKFIKK